MINIAEIVISTPNFFTSGSGTVSQILECNNNNPSNSKVVYTLSGDLPIPQDGFHDLTISGNVTSNSNFLITGDFFNSGTFTFIICR